MDIKAEIKVSFLAGLIEVKGAGSFLKEKKRTSKSASMTLMYNKATGTDRIELRHLKDFIDFDALKNTNATHVVISLDWGANCSISSSYEYSKSENKQEISGMLGIELKKIGGGLLDISGKAEVDMKDKDLSNRSKFKYQWNCDVGPDGAALPITFDGKNICTYVYSPISSISYILTI